MGDLPDLDTSKVGYIAYWNAGSDGDMNLDNFDPEEMLSANRLVSYTTYDNGWEGTVQLGDPSQTSQENWNQPKAQIRAKTDGWIVCYIDRTNNYERLKDDTYGDMSNFQGYWRLHEGFEQEYSPASIDADAFARAINHVIQELTSLTWNYSDVGLYNYDHSSATNTTGMSGYGSSETSPRLVVASGTTIHYSAATGCVTKPSSGLAVHWEGITLADGADSSDEADFGSYDIGSLTEGTEYGHDVDDNGRFNPYTVTFMWS